MSPVSHGGTADRSVISRSFKVLDAFGPNVDELTLAELARRTEIPKSSLHRLVTQLVGVGALDRSDGSYRLGGRMFELARLVPIHRRLREAALPFLIDLYEATHQVVHLGVREGNDVVYVERIAGHDSGPCPTRVGGRMPLHCTGLGKALLAYSDREIQQKILEGELKPYTPYTTTVPHVLRENLDAIRSAGVAFDREETKLGLVCVGAPILMRGEAIGALSIAGPTLKTNIDRLAGAVRTAAITLSRTVAADPLLMHPVMDK
jgi:DNA-binding IclR family transcriptional regulator